ncbi:TonB-dependent receptor [Dysgonomonas sp. Marseille-P4677]|uniref:TonB-dependent receptor plug domain-containing protein n=1 Tax=Dysgonomonas sp. Marseille-P4677 TaxID=2364790 RepID=UPI0019122C7A|nr:TonB-dependent receptor [Dysgonomonas sp. Marseille-P4677]MBK5720572.1 TonB-dependent receptor [Dysgonomonas sp. Marseille-P4677]
MNRKHFEEQRAYRFKRFARKAYSAFNSMRRVVNIGVVRGCAIAFLTVSTVSAQTSTNGEEQQKVMEKELDEVMVTASRIETPINQVAKLVTVISKEQIAQAPVQSIQDLLNYVAGIDVVQRGGHGVQADISIRGGSFDQSAVLLNGVNLTNPQTGHYSLDFPINLSDIERIEIIQGPSALIYGSGAFSGGINIITKKNTNYKAYAKVQSGMHKLRGIEVRGATKIGATINTLSVGSNSSAGYIDNSEYDIYNMLWQTRLQLRDESRIDLQLGYNDKEYGANTFYSAKYPNQYERTSTYMGTLKGEFGSQLKVIPIVYWYRHHDQYDLTKDSPEYRNYHRNDTYGANLILSYKSRLGNTSLGGELRREDIMSSNLGKLMVEPHRKYTKYDDRTNMSVSLEHTVSISKVVLSAGVLLNHNTLRDSENRFYPSASVCYRPSDNVTVASSWSKATRMPTFTDLSYDGPIHQGKADLDAERSESVDMTFKYRHRLFSAHVTGYLLWGRNMIDWVKEPGAGPNDPYMAWNLTRLNTQGVEVGAQLRIGELLPVLGDKALLSADYVRLHQSSNAGELLSKNALNYLRDKFTLHLHHRIINDLSADWNYRLQKRMGAFEKYLDGVKTGERTPYSTVNRLDLRLSYKYRDVLLNLDLNNIVNNKYYDLANIPQAGFWLMGGISYTFK